MTKDIHDQDIQELQATIQQANLLLEQRQKEQIQNAYKTAVAAAESVGLSLDELVAYSGKKSRKSNGKKVEPRYRNPNDQTQTWTGRGKQPRWLADALAAGKKLDDFKI